ncbi:hypothetical protein HOLleu_38721 [Holothuria leucospilota]|uniref:Fibronectin type-III domain-containing protein n=1 Tax=Holothuria leucospilota TaxID=206669 RepID=A0A9Q0YHC8_HOLLE|nr:hypothetical protein HOLleu_38721 [Holothuria leucospilota]
MKLPGSCVITTAPALKQCAVLLTIFCASCHAAVTISFHNITSDSVVISWVPNVQPKEGFNVVIKFSHKNETVLMETLAKNQTVLEVRDMLLSSNTDYTVCVDDSSNSRTNTSEVTCRTFRTARLKLFPYALASGIFLAVCFVFVVILDFILGKTQKSNEKNRFKDLINVGRQEHIRYTRKTDKRDKRSTLPAVGSRESHTNTI